MMGQQVPFVTDSRTQLSACNLYTLDKRLGWAMPL